MHSCPVDSKSDGLIFYYPSTKQLFSADDGFRIDSTLPSKSQFWETYHGTFIFNTKETSDLFYCPYSYKLSNTIYYNINKNWKQEKVVNQPVDKDNDPYLIQDIDTVTFIKSLSISLQKPIQYPKIHQKMQQIFHIIPGLLPMKK